MTSPHNSLLLYVEDEPMIAMVVREALEGAGFAIEQAMDGKAAIAALEARITHFKALVTDVRLPHVEGWEIAQRARELNALLPVVYVSGDSAMEWTSKGVPNSIMVQKPFANAQLIAAITTLINQAGPMQSTEDTP